MELDGGYVQAAIILIIQVVVLAGRGGGSREPTHFFEKRGLEGRQKPSSTPCSRREVGRLALLWNQRQNPRH